MSRRMDAYRLARDTFSTGSWMVVRLLSLGIWLLVMAQLLPAADFGWLASVLGIAAVCSMFVGAGIPYLFFSAAHEDSQQALGIRWGELLGCLFISGPLLVLLALLFIAVWMPMPVPVGWVMALLVAEIPLVGLVQSSGLLLHAKRDFVAASGLPAMMTVGRAISAGLALVAGMSLGGYLIVHVVTALAMCIAVMAWASKKGCQLSSARKPSVKTLRAASSYAVMAASSLANSELDKPILARISGLVVTGHYALAYRICAAIAMPVTALSASLLPRWTRMLAAADHRGLRRSFVLMFVLVASVSIATSALLQMLLEHAHLNRLGFNEGVVSLMRSLVWIIGPIGLHQLAGTSLLAVKQPLHRAVFDLIGLGMLAGAFIYSYARLGPHGLALACGLVEGVIACLMAATFLRSISKADKAVRNGVVE